MIKTNYLSTCVPTHKVIQNKNKYIAHNTMHWHNLRTYIAYSNGEIRD